MHHTSRFIIDVLGQISIHLSIYELPHGYRALCNTLFVHEAGHPYLIVTAAEWAMWGSNRIYTCKEATLFLFRRRVLGKSVYHRFQIAYVRSGAMLRPFLNLLSNGEKSARREHPNTPLWFRDKKP